MDNKFNEIFPFFDFFNKEFAPGSHLIDTFSSQFSFHFSNEQSNKNIKTYIHHLNNILFKSSLDLSYALVISDASIKNNVITSIVHIHVHDKPIIKTIYHTVNIIFIEAELFTIRCSINQATNIPSISKIIVITDSIYATRRIFDSLSHPFQIYAVSISNKLRKFFIKNHDNLIKLWECSSHCEWSLHKVIDKETK